ncbi:LacI family DNA-binding transcriptional regulator [Lacrimispora algidixylanolytica]|uniref:LacI family transcriptional regulator n=1 Tax=Lacrimispora algidixylanolytica TaxID=94868 RepID=A0A419SW28_9FIRM|nr:LacI family DNA-binding transcriptional regulator [Lacrimispora algidixylanolytica]RKD29420.1 LacI family transcriptional regulator [Lacrimispora algidixylanolytica]
MNIYDVSKHAHVSIATVSRVINGNPNVSEKTRQRVVAVMEELGYTPNVFARSLGLNTMKTIGIMCSDSSDPWLAEAISYLEKELRSNGYDSILCCSGYLPETKKKYLELLCSKRVDAIILTGSHYIEAKAKDNAYLLEAAKDIPIMLVNGHLDGEQIYSTVCDDQAAVYDAVTKLIQAGRTSILYLYSGNSYSNLLKLSGYRKALEDAGLPLRDELLVLCPKDIDSAMEHLKLLSSKGIHFDAVFAAEDILAVSAVKYGDQSGLKIPEDINIIGYNNSILSRCTTPEITSVDNKVEAICTTTIHTLMKVLNNGNVPAKTTITPELVKRGTTNF